MLTLAVQSWLYSPSLVTSEELQRQVYLEKVNAVWVIFDWNWYNITGEIDVKVTFKSEKTSLQRPKCK